MIQVPLETLIFGSSGNARPHLEEGWSHDEDALVWAIGQQSRLSLPRPTGEIGYLLEITVWPHGSLQAVTAQRLTIEVNGVELVSYTITRHCSVQCAIPAFVAAAADKLNIVFRHPDARRPYKPHGSGDDRLLAVAFQQCRLSVSNETIPPRDSDYLVPPPELLFDGTSDAKGFKASGEGFTRAFLIERAHLDPGERVLDLGSGNGQKARLLAYHLNRTGSYEGLDVVPAGVEWCQQR